MVIVARLLSPYEAYCEERPGGSNVERWSKRRKISESLMYAELQVVVEQINIKQTKEL